MTKAEFLDDPLGHYYGRKGRTMMGSIPIEWLREAWDTNAPFRTDATAALLKSISKQGSLGFAGEWVGQLAANLSAEQSVLLFEALREGVNRSEREWRAEFEQAFTQCEGLLRPRQATGRPDSPGSRKRYQCTSKGRKCHDWTGKEGGPERFATPGCLSMVENACRVPVQTSIFNNVFNHGSRTVDPLKRKRCDAMLDFPACRCIITVREPWTH